MSATLKITSTTTAATRDRGLLDQWLASKLGNGSMGLLLEDEGHTYNIYNRRSLAAYMSKVNRTVKNQLVLASRGGGPGGGAGAVLADTRRGSAMETIGTNGGKYYSIDRQWRSLVLTTSLLLYS
jgi:hypothetical protein